MSIFLYASILVFGTIVGSFLNVVVLRYGTGMSIARGRSQCFSCGKMLHWYELVPVASFIFLWGRCSVCKSKISWQYPLVEMFTGLLFLATFIHVGISVYLPYYWFVMSLLVAISVYDFKHKIIPDGMAFLFGFVTLIASLFTFFYTGENTVFDILAGPVLALPFALLWLVSRGRWIGLGDAKLVIGIGFMLGLAKGVSAVVLAFWIGAGISVAIIIIQKSRLLLSSKNLTMKSEIPFGPFLILGTLIVFFFGLDVMGISAILGI